LRWKRAAAFTPQTCLMPNGRSSVRCFLPARQSVRTEESTCGRSSTAFSVSIGRAVNDECCPRNTKTGIPPSATTIVGVKTVPSSAFTMHHEKNSVVKTVASQRPAPLSSTANRSKRPKERTSRIWGYDDTHHIVSEVDKRGFREEMQYDVAGRAKQATRKDGSILRYSPVQSRGFSRLL